MERGKEKHRTGLRMLVISTCTGKKTIRVEKPLVLDDFRDPARLRRREKELAEWKRPARELYKGQQHLLAMRGVDRLRREYGHGAVAVRILSAGYGLIEENHSLAPYDVTFDEMSSREARNWADQIGIPGAVRNAIRGYPCAIFLVGEDYLRAIDLPVNPLPEQRLIFLTNSGMHRQLARAGVTVVPVGIAESQRYGASTISLKGKMFDLLSHGIVALGHTEWRELLRDNTPKTILRIVDMGARIEKDRLESDKLPPWARERG